MADGPSMHSAEPDDNAAGAARRSTLRHVRTAILCLLAGALINVLVAWVIVICPNLPPVRPSGVMIVDSLNGPDAILTPGSYLREHWHTPETRVTIHPRQLWIHQVYREESRGSGIMGSYWGPRFWLYEEEFQDLLPRWSRFRDGEPTLEWVVETHPRRAIITYVETTAGWPFKSVRGSALTFERDSLVDTAPLHPDSIQNLLRLPEDFGLTDERRELPFRPVFPEFLANTALYAAGVLLLWLLSRTTARAVQSSFGLRSRRRRRGLCPACAYDLRGADHEVCPECGEVVVGSQRSIT